MQGVAILIGLELLVAVPCYLAARGRWDRTLLYVLAVTAPLEVYRTGIAGINLSLFRLSVLGGLVWLGTDFVRRKTGEPLVFVSGSAAKRLVLAYVLLAVLVAVSLLFTTANEFLAKRLLAVILLGVAAITVVDQLARRSPAEEILKAFALGSVLPILAASWQGLSTTFGVSAQLPLLNALPAEKGLEKTRDALISFQGVGTRVKGTFGDPNHYGVYLALVVAAAIALFLLARRQEDRRSTTMFGALLAAAGASLVATYSRTAWLAGTVAVLAIAILVAPTVRRFGVPKRLRLTTPVAIVVALLALSPAAVVVVERLDPSSSINVETNRSHSETLHAALDQFRAHPLFGIGVGELGIVLDQGPRTSGAHSSYLTVAAELGVLGLSAVLIALALAVTVAARAYWGLRTTAAAFVPAALLSSYLAFVVANATYDLLWDDFHWVLLGGIAGCVGTVPPSVRPRGIKRLLPGKSDGGGQRGTPKNAA